MSDGKQFYLDRVKAYLDEVLANEEYLKTYKDVADDVYRVYNNCPRVSVKDVTNYLRGLPLGVAFEYCNTVPLARKFCKDISSLTAGERSEDDCYWWALSTAIWIYGNMSPVNPQFKPKKVVISCIGGRYGK